jgi:hypothetical protein
MEIQSLENTKAKGLWRGANPLWSGGLVLLSGVLGVIILVSLGWSPLGHAEPQTVYAAKTKFDFDGMSIEGELRNPSEFYFQHKEQEKVDSLVKRRKNFHRELLRDVVMSR